MQISEDTAVNDLSTDRLTTWQPPIESAPGTTDARSAADSDSPLRLIDAAKGLAILGVVLVHVLHGWFGWQGVHVFIVLSGFGLLYARRTIRAAEPWRHWLRRRAARILPAYWLVALCGYGLVVGVQALGLAEPGMRVERPGRNLLLDLLLLRNLRYQGMFGYPNASLWYVPLIIGCYAVFPWLSALVGRRDGAGLLRLLLAGLAIEALCRALALYALDGMPVGYGHGFWPGLPQLDNGRDLVPAAFPFQLWAPFGLFPTRIAEFLAGMIAAEQYVRDPQRFTHALRRWWVGLAGLALWLGGNALLYVGLWGWIAADALIAVGLTITLLRLVWLLRRALPRLFGWLDALGRWSAELFLTHLVVLYGAAVLLPHLAARSAWLLALLLPLTIAALWLACVALRRFERSRWLARDQRPRLTGEEVIGESVG